MRGSSVTRRYAKALLDLVDDSSAEAARTALVRLSQLVAAVPQLKHLLASPAFSLAEKHAVTSALAERLGSPPVLARFVSHLVTRNRIGLLPDIADSFETLLDERKGRRRISVTSATPLNREEQSRLRGRLTEILRRDVDIEFAARPDLLAGVQIRIDTTVFDSSVRTRLNAIESVLTKE